ncbi:MAG: hypothetical protein AVDCRST_MAG41-4523 [uncultured Corynebacteriales bacterium]|uniref:Major facilitator superfamily (MFS) profile domain-containing protein n=1 Tax=uncultured Mycobacteriales bacterium TaxID=581187 RepID=A0A6J4JYB0_9ACTN|nr:MAG: hypothetical protein AVDCRST_MAG41-4523 [uncultured Corynebacteriales bacterium]
MRRSSLRGTGFFTIWLGESLSLVGAQVTFFALPLVAILALDADALGMGLLTAAGSLAVLLLAPSIGVWADHHERRTTMVVANLARGLLLGTVPLAYVLDALTLPLLIAVAFGVGALTLLFDSAMSSYVPALVGPKRLVAANSWMQSSISVADTAGPGLAGLLVQVLGAPIAVLADALSYLASTVALLASPRVGKPPEPAERELHWAAIKQGLRIVLTDRIQRPLALAAGHFNLFTSMFFTLYLLFLVRTLDFSPLLIGLLNIAGGVAGLTGAGISARLARRFGYGPVLTVVYALPGVAALLVPLAGRVGPVSGALLVAASSALWSGSVIVNLVLSESIKQALVPHHLLGRATSIIRFISFGVEPIGALLGAALVGLGLSLGGTLAVASIGVGSSAVWLLASGVAKLQDPVSPAPAPTPAGTAPEEV